MFTQKLFHPDPENPTGGQTPAVTTPNNDDELEKLRKQVKDQNSYITKLEAERAAKPAPAAQPATPTPASTPQTIQRDPYIVELQTKDLINEGKKAIEAKLGKEVFSEIEEDFVVISKANIKDPSVVKPDFFERVAQTALGKNVLNGGEKAIKIAGAIAKTPPVVQPTQPQTVVVPSPAGQKLNTMSPSDKPALGGTNTTTPPGGTQKPRGLKEFISTRK